jgi:hypothetical protein
MKRRNLPARPRRRLVPKGGWPMVVITGLFLVMAALTFAGGVIYIANQGIGAAVSLIAGM